MSTRKIATTSTEVLDMFKCTPAIRGSVTAPFHLFEPDSITLVEMVMEAEKRLGVDIPDRAFMHAGTAGAAADAVASYINNHYGREPQHPAPHRFEGTRWR